MSSRESSSCSISRRLAALVNRLAIEPMRLPGEQRCTVRVARAWVEAFTFPLDSGSRMWPGRRRPTSRSTAAADAWPTPFRCAGRLKSFHRHDECCRA